MIKDQSILPLVIYLVILITFTLDDLLMLLGENWWWSLLGPKGLSPSAKQCRNSCSGPPPEYQDLSAGHDWPVKKAIVNLPVRLKGNSKRTPGSSLSPLGALRMDFKAAWQTLLTGVRLRLRRRPGNTKIPGGGGLSWEFLVGMCRPVLQIPTLFQTKKWHLPHPFSDQISKIQTCFQTWL